MIRLDHALVERGLCESREQAKRLVLAGQVRINLQTARKPSDPIKPADALTLDAREKYVSRGGHKLEHALVHFRLDVAGFDLVAGFARGLAIDANLAGEDATFGFFAAFTKAAFNQGLVESDHGGFRRQPEITGGCRRCIRASAPRGSC